MKKKYKKIMKVLGFWIGAGLVFSLVALFLILWAAGIRYNYKATKFQKIGIVNLDSSPQNVEIYVNGKIHRRGTPARLNLLPGKYNIKIHKAGFSDFEKTVQVESGRVQNFQNIILFLKDPHLEEIASNVKNVSVSPNKERVLFKNSNFSIYDVKTRNIQKLTARFKNATFLDWSENSDKIIFQNGKEYLIYNISSESITIPRIGKTEKVIFDPTDSNKLIYTQNLKLYSINLENFEETKLSDQIYSLEKDNSRIYTIQSVKNKLLLIKSNSNFRSRQNLVEVSDAKSKIYPDNSAVAIINSKNKLYIVSNGKLKLIASNVNNVSWTQDAGFFGFFKKSVLLYTNNNQEIYYLEMGKNKPKLVLRVMSSISEAQWYSNINYFVSSIDGKIKISELSGENNTLLAEGTFFEILSDKKIVYIDKNGILTIAQIRN